MSEPCIRGPELLRERRLVRFPFLKQPKQKYEGEELPRHMQEDMLPTSTAYPKWVPRDCLASQNSSTYAEFAAKGFADDYEVPLSLVGHGGTPNKPPPLHVRNNKFTRPQYSYIHMPFAQLPGFIARLHPDDRYLAFLLTEDAQTVHVYFDIDGDFDKFPHMRGREEFYVARFVEQIAKFFKRTFKRAMDLRGLLLLQASNEKKMSWHVHISTEAFSNVKQHKIFVQLFRAHLEKHPQLELCVRSADATKQRIKEFHHVVDPAPYGANQNFRAPYNQKPGKNPLKPRKHYWYGDNQLYCQATPASEEIDVEVLFAAHPNLALPTRQGYQPLVMPLEAEDKSQTRILKRKVPGSSSSLTGLSDKASRDAGALDSEETSVVRLIVGDALGSQVDFQELRREVNSYTGDHIIRGIARVGTSWCPHRTAINKAPYTHHSNRMRVELEDGALTFACFAPGCPKVYRPWSMDDAARQLLDPSCKPSTPAPALAIEQLVRASPPPATTTTAAAAAARDDESDEDYW